MFWLIIPVYIIPVYIIPVYIIPVYIILDYKISVDIIRGLHSINSRLFFGEFLIW